jgi:hypothetical protein
METSKASVAFIMNSLENVHANDQAVQEAAAPATPTPGRAEKRRARACKVDGCSNYIINKGLCFRHGVSQRLDNPPC